METVAPMPEECSDLVDEVHRRGFVTMNDIRKIEGLPPIHIKNCPIRLPGEQEQE